MTLTVGVDVGGTKVDACLADPTSGAVLARERIASRCERGGAAVLADCVELVRQLAADTPIAAVGIGICEFVDLVGRPTSAATLDWRGLDVVGEFRALAPARLESDVRAGALAEARFGAGRTIDGPWLYVTVGTGISACLILDGHPYTGAAGNALVVGAPPVELTASGLALQRRTGRPRAEDVLADATLAPLVDEAAAALGQGLAALVNALDPALVVVAGGLGLVDGYREAAVRAMRPAVEHPVTREVPVVPAALGTLAGPLGAALAGAAAAERRGVMTVASDSLRADRRDTSFSRIHRRYGQLSPITDVCYHWTWCMP